MGQQYEWGAALLPFVVGLGSLACGATSKEPVDFADGGDGGDGVAQGDSGDGVDDGATSAEVPDDGDGDGDTSGAADSEDGADDGDESGSGVLFDLPMPDAGDTGRPGTGPQCDVVAPTVAATPCNPTDIEITAEFVDDYSCVEFATVPGLPGPNGGVVFSLDDPDVLLIAGSANSSAGVLHAVRVTRDEQCHITGLADPMTEWVAEAQYNDGGLAFDGGGVLFLARWPVNGLGQQLPGSDHTDRIDDLAPLGLTGSSAAGLNFVPSEFPGEGQLKIVGWPDGGWWTIGLAADGSGTYAVTGVTNEVTIPGGPEGFVYVDDNSPGVDVPSIIVSEWSAGNVVIYDSDANGDPVVDTRREFIIGLEGAEGAHIDPTGGDFLFSTFGGGDRLVVISGFVPTEPPPPPPG